MKKILMFALCLLLMAGCLVSAGAEESGYAVGGKVSGFTVTDVRSFGMLGAVVTTLTHDSTGAVVMIVKNGDTDRVFEITFRTVAEDSTGTPHVFEHATLDGSAMFPSKELFFNLTYRTYNTYMNASTYSFMTTYPVSSLSEDQLLRYAVYYLDSCFNSAIMTDESIFDEEAWRYELAGEDSDLTITGTVYNEMKGSYTIESAAYFNSRAAAFPGTTKGNVSGGKPSDIPDLTYEALTEYHDRYYHPSNSLTVIYGDIEQPEAFLTLLDGVFSSYEYRSFEGMFDEEFTVPAESTVSCFTYGTEEGSSTEDGAYVYIYYYCPGADASVLDNLTTLIDADSFCFQQSVKANMPGVSANCYSDCSGPVPLVGFTAKGLDAEDAETFAAIVSDSLAYFAENGFDADSVDAIAANYALSTLLTADSDSVGVNVIPDIAYYWALNDDLYGYMDYIDNVKQLSVWAADGTFANVINEYLTDSAVTATAVTVPVAGQKEAEEAELSAKLAGIKAAMSAEEKAALIKKTTAAPGEKADTDAMVEQLTAVTVENLPEDIRLYEINDETGEDGVRRLYVPANVDGVGTTMVRLDMSGLNKEELQWLQLYIYLLSDVDTVEHSSAELKSLITRWCYDVSVRLVMPDDETADGTTPYLHISFTALDDEIAGGYNVLRELLLETKLDDTEMIASLVSTEKSSVKRDINANGLSVMIYRMFGNSKTSNAIYSHVNFLPYYEFLCSVESMLQDDPAAVTAALRNIQDYIAGAGAGIITGYAGSEAGYASHTAAADAFAASLAVCEHAGNEYEFEPTPMSEALVLETNTSFNMVYASWEDLGREDGYTAALDALCGFIDDRYLMPLLRDERGAYGAGCAADKNGIYMYSYRDPGVAATFGVFGQLSSLLAAETDVSQDVINGYILSSYSAYAAPSGELSGAYEALRYYLTGDGPDEDLIRMRELKSLSAEDIASASELLRDVMLCGRMATVSSASVINANSFLFENVLNPFGAVDNTDVTLNDVTEGSPYYEAVRYCFEQGFMSVDPDGNFSPEACATLGDVAIPFYMAALGGDDNAAEAVTTIAGYGIIDDFEPEYAINRNEWVCYICSFWYAVGGDIEEVEAFDLPDAAELDEGMQPYWDWCIAAGLICPTEAGAYGAAEPMSRGELAEAFCNFFSYMW